MKNILITGAAGFIGSNACIFFLNRGFKVFGIDNLISGSLSNISDLNNNKNFTFINHDICFKLNFKKKIDYILNLASPASPKYFSTNPLDIINANSLGIRNMLEFSKKNNSVIVISSTSEVYGDPKINPQSEDYFGNVNTYGLRSVYDESKRFSETLAYTYKKYFNVNCKIARIFNTYGPKMKNNDGRVIPNFFNQLKNNNSLTIYGDGKQTRSFCYIDDMLSGLYFLMKSDYYQPINLGNPNEISILELSKIFKKLFNKNLDIVFKPLPSGDPSKRKPDITMATNLLNWTPKISLEEGLKKTYKSLNN